MHWQLIYSVVLISITLADDNSSTSTGRTKDFDAAAPTSEMVAYDNYMVEIHHVKTEDDFILEMHRIPGSPTCPPANSKPIAFLMHGLFSSSADWLVSGPEKSIVYVLAHAGYDVWLGNARGSTYSMNHSRTVSDEEFWDFSWHEIGYFDLPAMIDYALEKTGQKQVVYVGHSQGTTTFFVMTSTRPEYNVKIKVMFSLASIAYFGRSVNPVLKALSAVVPLVKALFDRMGIHQLFASSHSLRKARADLCSNRIIGEFVCKNILFLLGGFDSYQLDVDLLPLIFGHYPASASVRQVTHYGQEIQSLKFRQYDFGKIQNWMKYGSETPPDYNLSSITAPVHLFYSGNDWLSAVQDVIRLYHELGNAIEMFRVPYAGWEHLDYVYGRDARTFIYEPIINTLAKSYGLPFSCS